MGKGLAIAALVLSLLFFVPFAPIVGIILGVVCLRKAPIDPTIPKGVAIAAIVIGCFTGLINLITVAGIIFGFMRNITG